MKKTLFILAIFTLVLTGCGKKEEKPNYNNDGNDKKPVVFQTQHIDGLQMSDFSLNLEDGTTNILVSIKNSEKNDMYIKIVEAYLYDEKENLLGDTYFYIDSTLKSGEEKIYQSGVASDVSNATRVEFKVVKL